MGWQQKKNLSIWRLLTKFTNHIANIKEKVCKVKLSNVRVSYSIWYLFILFKLRWIGLSNRIETCNINSYSNLEQRNLSNLNMTTKIGFQCQFLMNFDPFWINKLDFDPFWINFHLIFIKMQLILIHFWLKFQLKG